MSPSIQLPIGAPAAQIAEAIRAVQARSRARLCQDPEALAQRVRAQVDRVSALARGSGLFVSDLAPTAAWWEQHVYSAGEEQTLVLLRYGELLVQRAAPGTSTWNGRVALILDERRSA